MDEENKKKNQEMNYNQSASHGGNEGEKEIHLIKIRKIKDIRRTKKKARYN